MKICTAVKRFASVPELVILLVIGIVVLLGTSAYTQQSYDAAILHPNGRAYFFKGDKYYRFNFASDKVDKVGTINADGWQDLPNNIDAAILHPNGKAYFFKDDRYYRFNFGSDKVDRVATIGADGWSGLGLSQADLAAVDWCYSIIDRGKNIIFYPVVQNLGPIPFQSNRSGSYTLGATGGGGTTGIHDIPAGFWPTNGLGVGEKMRLTEGTILPYHPTYYYTLEWWLDHPDDINESNNRFKTNIGYGSDIENKMSHKKCSNY